MSAHAGALEAVDRILNRGDADALAAIVAVLHERVFAWVAVVRDGEVVVSAGERPDGELLHAASGRGELQAAPRTPGGDADRALLDRVALLVSTHV